MVSICTLGCINNTRFSIISVAIISKLQRSIYYYVFPLISHTNYPDGSPSVSDIIDEAPPEYIPILIISAILCIFVIGKFYHQLLTMENVALFFIQIQVIFKQVILKVSLNHGNLTAHAHTQCKFRLLQHRF